MPEIPSSCKPRNRRSLLTRLHVHLEAALVVGEGTGRLIELKKQWSIDRRDKGRGSRLSDDDKPRPRSRRGVVLWPRSRRGVVGLDPLGGEEPSERSVAIPVDGDPVGFGFQQTG